MAKYLRSTMLENEKVDVTLDDTDKCLDIMLLKKGEMRVSEPITY